MKKVLIVLLCALALVPAAYAQSSLKGISLNGSTGLFSIPSGRIGWERSSDLGLDIGYHAVIDGDGDAAHIPTMTVSLFKWVEFSTAFDIQPDFNVTKKGKRELQKNDDLLFGLKVQLPTNVKNTRNPAIALGTNIQLINVADDDRDTSHVYTYTAFQFYAAATYAGTFFTLPAETTVVMGKSVYAGADTNSDIDFGMGFDLILFPDVIGNYVHWVIDFANFDYSDNSWPHSPTAFHSGPSWNRGILNTGFRIDLAAIPALSEFKFTIDMIFRDLFDEGNRSFTIGAVFGMPLL